MTNAEIIWKYFENKKFNPYAIAGIMGNMKAESNLLPNNLQNTYNVSLGMTDEQYTKAVDSGAYTNFIHDSAGYGLVQWTYWSLKEELYNLCKERGKSISDINCQLDCLYQQLTKNKLLGSLNAATSIRAASDIFLTKFERPKDQSEQVQTIRANYGQQFYNQFINKQGGGTSLMKYSNSNPPLVCMQTQSTCYRGTGKMAVKGILWHSTGANNTTIKRYVQPSDNDPNRAALLDKIGVNQYHNDWNHTSVQAGLNAWIGTLADGNVAAVQTMPWDYRPWGCGSGSRGSCNNGWIQFEICEDNLTNGTYFYKVYQEACELTAYLCKLYNLNPKGSVNLNGVSVPVILCHQDSYRLGLGSNHSDVYHWFNKYGKTMDTVRDDVAKLMGDSSSVTPTSPSSSVTPSPSSSGLLRKGDEGSAVKELQENLIKLGYSCGKWGADGDFGNDTLKAVLKFQEDHHLEVDGVVGSATQNAIKAALAEAIPTNEIYRVRKAWNNPASQVGAYRDLNNAKAAVDKLGSAYHVYNSKGQEIYPTTTTVSTPDPKPETPTLPSTPLTPARTYNDVMIGSASKDERGQYVGGQAGDQTGKEVYILNWYNQNWNYVLRPIDANLAEKIARACEAGCDNNNIGYSQSARNTIYTEALKVGLDLSKITTPCNCDCSSFASTCCICAGLPASIFYAGGNMRTTYTMVQACKDTGKFKILTGNDYTKVKDYLKRGDLLLNSNQHVVIVLADGTKAEKNSSQPTQPQPTNSNSFLVKIVPASLNVRKAPSETAGVSTVVHKGYVFTIVEEKEGWGRLKSGAGWINLSYTQRV